MIDTFGIAATKAQPMPFKPSNVMNLREKLVLLALQEGANRRQQTAGNAAGCELCREL